MAQLNSFNVPPPPTASEIPILTVLKDAYLMWHSFLPHLPRLTRYTLGIKIDNLFIDLLEITLTAKYTKREEKLIVLNTISRKLDNLKFFVTVLWEAKGVSPANYGQLAQKLSSIGTMLGGWTRKLTSPQK